MRSSALDCPGQFDRCLLLFTYPNSPPEAGTYLGVQRKSVPVIKIEVLPSPTPEVPSHNFFILC